MAKFVTASEFKDRFGEKTFLQLFDRNQDGQPETRRFVLLTATVDRKVEAVLVQKLGTRSELIADAVHDAAIRNCAVELLMALACEGRHEFMGDNGVPLYEPMRKRATAELADYAAGLLRAPESPANQHAKKRARHFKAEPRRFIAPSPDCPKGPGGF